MTTLEYLTYKEESKELNKAIEKAEITLSLVSDAKKGGLVSDAVKSSKEYKKANLAFKVAFKEYRLFNQLTPKAFKIRESKERRLEMMNR